MAWCAGMFLNTQNGSAVLAACSRRELPSGLAFAHRLWDVLVLNGVIPTASLLTLAGTVAAAGPCLACSDVKLCAPSATIKPSVNSGSPLRHTESHRHCFAAYVDCMVSNGGQKHADGCTGQKHSLTQFHTKCVSSGCSMRIHAAVCHVPMVGRLQGGCRRHTPSRLTWGR